MDFDIPVMPPRPQWSNYGCRGASSSTSSLPHITSFAPPWDSLSTTDSHRPFALDGSLASSPRSLPAKLPARSPTSPQSLDWIEFNMASQLGRLDVELQTSDFSQRNEPSLFGLRRKVAAAMPQLGFEEGTLHKKRSRRPRASNAADLLHRANSSDDASGCDAPFQLVTWMPSEGRDHAKQMAKLERELQEREKDLQIQLLSRFEISELNMDIYTEQRTGEWMQRGAAPQWSRPAESLPRIFSPWDINVDTQAIIKRNKLRSYIELVDSTTVLKCLDCEIYEDRKAGYRYDSDACDACQSTGLVKLVYVVCVTLRQSKFLPLHLPLVHLGGWYQDTIRHYLHTPEQHVHPATLTRRAMEVIRASAYRVGMAHAKQHDARLLCVKASLQKRSCNSVVVLHRQTGVMRTFDITDSGILRYGSSANSSDDAIRIRETPEVTRWISSEPLIVRAEGLYHLSGVERLVEMTQRTTYNQFSIALDPVVPPRSPSVASDNATLYPEAPLDAPLDAPLEAPSPYFAKSPLVTRSASDLPTTVCEIKVQQHSRFRAETLGGGGGDVGGGRGGGGRQASHLARSLLSLRKMTSKRRKKHVDKSSTSDDEFWL
ncbi:hypothetical protein ACQY0O_004052 [Thecaphora frezii]